MISIAPEDMYIKTPIMPSDKLSISLIEASPMFLDFAGHGWIAWMRDSKITLKYTWYGRKFVEWLVGVKAMLDLVDSRHLVFESKMVRGPLEDQSVPVASWVGSH